MTKGEKSDRKWLWSFLIPIVVSLATYLITGYLEHRSQSKKVQAYATIWRTEFQSDSTRLWREFEADSVYWEAEKADSLRKTLGRLSARGLGRSGAVKMYTEKINNEYKRMISKRRNTILSDIEDMRFELEAFEQTGLVLKK